MIGNSGDLARRALADRLTQIGPLLLEQMPEPSPDPSEHAARLILAIAETVTSAPTNEHVWIVLSGIASAYPTRDQVDDTRRAMELMGADEAAAFLLDSCLRPAIQSGQPTNDVLVVTDQVLVDVDFTARHELNTGIQRVVRQTLPVWRGTRDFIPTAWSPNQGALRTLDDTESARVFSWHNSARPPAGSGDLAPRSDPPLLLPWNCVILLAEVPPPEAIERIAAIGAYSTNRVAAVGYDMIPLVSAETVPLAEPKKFMPYLSAIKFADIVGGISETAAQEFRCFTSMLSSQGLTGPAVVSVPLPAEITEITGTANDQIGRANSTTPEIVVVGSHDVRKNHLPILHAAELMWQEGLTFNLTFIGGGGSNSEFYRRVGILKARDRPVSVRVAVPENELRAAVASARFTVFPSIHEGYGLPVAESMALGTPVITTNYGSTAEIAAAGGALLVDPRSDGDIGAAMRRLLLDDAVLEQLRDQIRRRTERNWQSYADDLWAGVVQPLLDDRAGPRPPAGR